MTHWNWLDWIFAVIVFGSIVTAVFKGFVAELVSLASLIAALIVAGTFYERAGGLLQGFTGSRTVAMVAAFIVLFVAVLVLGALVSIVARKLIRKVELQWFDRFLGAVFGLMRGLLVACAMLLLMMAFAIAQGAVHKSVLVPYLTAGSRIIALAMPGPVRNDFRSGLEKFQKALVRTDKKAMAATAKRKGNF